MRRSLLLSLMSVALVFLLIGCSSQEEVDEKEVEELKNSLIEDVVKENPSYSKEALESRWAVVKDLVPYKSQLAITIEDQKTKEILILRDEKQKLSELEKGHNIVVVTPKVWFESLPLKNIPIKLVIL